LATRRELEELSILDLKNQRSGDGFVAKASQNYSFRPVVEAAMADLGLDFNSTNYLDEPSSHLKTTIYFELEDERAEEAVCSSTVELELCKIAVKKN
jgi:hypothetical protein